MSQELIFAFLNLPLRHLLFSLLVLALLYLIANRTAYCLLRSRNIPRSSAGTVSSILSAALFIIYLFIGVIIYFAVFAPQRAEIVRALLPPPSDILPSKRSPAPVPPQTSFPQGKMAAENNWRERRQQLAATTEQLVKAMIERQRLFAQEQRYVISEGISGTEDYYLPPQEDAEPSPEETRIAVDKPVSFADEISAYFNQPEQASAPAPPQQPEQPSPEETRIAVDKPISFAAEISAYFNQPEQASASAPPPSTSIYAEDTPATSNATIPDPEPSLPEKATRQDAAVPPPSQPRVSATINLAEHKDLPLEPEKVPVVLEPSQKLPPQDAAVSQAQPPRVSTTITLAEHKDVPPAPEKTPPAPHLPEKKPEPRPLQRLAPVKEVSCGEIRMYLDAADLQIFARAMRQEEGRPTSWKGPGGSYTVTPGPIKGRCREYSMKAKIQAQSLRCYASCINTTSIDQAIKAAAEALQEQDNDNDKIIILRSMNRGDLDALSKALTYHGPISWRSMSGIFYTVSPVRLGNPCREYKVKANIRGKIYEYIASQCN